LRRKSRYKRYITDENSTARLYLTQRIAIGRAPQYPGYDLLGNESATGLISGTPEPFNLVAWNYTTWFSQCFVGSRGSYHYIMNALAPSTIGSMSVDRTNAVHTTQYFELLSAPNSADIQKDYVNSVNTSLGMAGTSLVNQLNLSGLSISAPMYSAYKFMINDPLLRTDGSSIDDSNNDTLHITTVTLGSTTNNQSELVIDTYVAAGTDFSLIFFLNVPTVFKYSSYPLVV